VSPEPAQYMSSNERSLSRSGTARRCIAAALGLALPAFLCGPAMRAEAAGPGADPVVHAQAGSLRGLPLQDGPGAVFKGIPYAKPPVGALRWREPLPIEPWRGVRDALRSGPPAAQASFKWNDEMAAASREDCLYLDVWTPRPETAAGLPVMVWFHGGGHVGGSGGFDPLYDGTRMIRRGVILVVVEFRLGVFGFFSHPELSRESAHGTSGNYGFLDQVAAPKWVRANIASFGGDPAKVTIFGESAGSIDVTALMTSPLADGLYRSAIAESGCVFRNAASTPAQAEHAGVEFARRLKAPETGALAYLRSLPSAEVLKAGPGFLGMVVDGWVFPRSPYDSWKEGHEAHVPVIIGFNGVEIPAPGPAARVAEAMTKTFGDLAPRALDLYGLAPASAAPAPDPVYGDVADQWGSDSFRSTGILFCDWHSRSVAPAWSYEFDRAIPPHLRSSHGCEMPYVFGNMDLGKSNLAGDFNDTDRALSSQIQAYWTNFAKSGTPDGDGLPEWPAYDG
jgi:para-nitrobenzyl esterase